MSDDEAVFTVLAAVGLQGIRLADPTLGKSVAVVGLGLAMYGCCGIMARSLAGEGRTGRYGGHGAVG